MDNRRSNCKVCGIWCDTEEMLRKHELGKKHRSKLVSFYDKNQFSSEICSSLHITMPQLVSPTSSVGSIPSSFCDSNVQKNMNSVYKNADYDVSSNFVSFQTPRSFKCVHCNVILNSQAQLDNHIRGRRHYKSTNLNESFSVCSSNVSHNSNVDSTETNVSCFILNLNNLKILFF